MKTTNPMQLKALVKNKAEKVGIPPHFAMQTYMMERLLERISLSDYKTKFVIKGGLLISAMIGSNLRATMDMDATLVRQGLTPGSIKDMFEAIAAVEVDDGINFVVKSITDIEKTDEYSGFRVHMEASFPPIAQPLSVDVTTGDRITPKEIEFMYPLIFEDKTIPIMAYNAETILAEKLETIISRGISTTRPRDFYDIYMLWRLECGKIDVGILHKAVTATCENRKSLEKAANWKDEMERIANNKTLKSYWEQYRKEFSYARNMGFEETCEVVKKIFNALEMENLSHR